MDYVLILFLLIKHNYNAFTVLLVISFLENALQKLELKIYYPILNPNMFFIFLFQYIIIN